MEDGQLLEQVFIPSSDVEDSEWYQILQFTVVIHRTFRYILDRKGEGAIASKGLLAENEEENS